MVSDIKSAFSEPPNGLERYEASSELTRLGYSGSGLQPTAMPRYVYIYLVIGICALVMYISDNIDGLRWGCAINVIILGVFSPSWFGLRVQYLCACAFCRCSTIIFVSSFVLLGAGLIPMLTMVAIATIIDVIRAFVAPELRADNELRIDKLFKTAQGLPYDKNNRVAISKFVYLYWFGFWFGFIIVFILYEPLRMIHGDIGVGFAGSIYRIGGYAFPIIPNMTAPSMAAGHTEISGEVAQLLVMTGVFFIGFALLFLFSESWKCAVSWASIMPSVLQQYKRTFRAYTRRCYTLYSIFLLIIYVMPAVISTVTRPITGYDLDSNALTDPLMYHHSPIPLIMLTLSFSSIVALFGMMCSIVILWKGVVGTALRSHDPQS